MTTEALVKLHRWLLESGAPGAFHLWTEFIVSLPNDAKRAVLDFERAAVEQAWQRATKPTAAVPADGAHDHA